MGAWIETGMQNVKEKNESSRTLYGCVDWNFLFPGNPTFEDVALYMGAWIETYLSNPLSKDWIVALYMGAWIETSFKYQGAKV